MQEFKAEDNINGPEILIGLLIITTVMCILNFNNYGCLNTEALSLLILYAVIIIPFLFYVGIINTFERLLRNDYSLIVEQRIFSNFTNVLT